MTNENIRVVEPIVMRLKYPSKEGVLSKNLSGVDIDFIKETKEKGSVILEVDNESEINTYIFEWLTMVAEIPGMEKTYPHELNLLTDPVTYEMAFLEIIRENSYNVISLIPIELKYNHENGTTLYLCKLTKIH